MNLRQNIPSGVSKSLFLSFIVKVKCNSAAIFLWDNTEKKRKRHYHIQEWHKFTAYDILQNQYNYPTVCTDTDTDTVTEFTL